MVGNVLYVSSGNIDVESRNWLSWAACAGGTVPDLIVDGLDDGWLLRSASRCVTIPSDMPEPLRRLIRHGEGLGCFCYIISSSAPVENGLGIYDD